MMKVFAGVSKIEITTDKSEVNDPLYAKVIVLKSKSDIIALISMDYVSLGGGISEIDDNFFVA